MKRNTIIIIVAVIVVVSVLGAIVFSLYPPSFSFFGGTLGGGKSELEADSYRLCKDENGEDIIIIKYLLKNNSKETTSLYFDFHCTVYQNGIELSEAYDELPKEYDYDSEDQYRNIKSGVEFYAEIAYKLEDLEGDIEVEIDRASLFGKKKVKVFELK